MFQLSLLVISYGSLMLLLMPTTIVGIVSTVVMFIGGFGVMVYKKVYKIAFWKSKQYFLIPVAIAIVVQFGQVFYNDWLPSSKVQIIATMFHISIEMFLLIASIILSGLSVYFIYVVLQVILNKLMDTDEKNDFERSLLFSVITAIITVILAQIMIGVEIFSMGYFNFLWGVLIVLTTILAWYGLLGRIMPSMFIGSGLFIIVSTINVYVYSFREQLFEPIDILSVGTAMNVVENYNLFPIPFSVQIGWSVFIGLMAVLYFLRKRTLSGLSIKRRITLLLICAISSGAIFLYTSDLKTDHWEKWGAYYNVHIPE